MSLAALKSSPRIRAEAALRLLAMQDDEPEESVADRYRFDPAGYMEDKLGWTPWSGSPDQPGQAEVIHAYQLALEQQHERLAYERGEIAEDELQTWTPGQVIRNRIRVEAGHTVGKTKLASGIVNHFFDCFPCIGYAFAPTAPQIDDLLFKEIRKDRAGKALGGRVYDGKPEMMRSKTHFVKGRAASNARGTGTENVQGQHEPYLIFVMDEAEGIADFVWDAIESMASGGIVIILMLANPRTRVSRFHKIRTLSTVRSFRISCVHHPNVVEGREIIPGAVRRDYVESMIEQHCELVDEHSEDDQTFELAFPVRVSGAVLDPGQIFAPNAEFMFRVLGMPPRNLADNTLVPVGRFQAATKREPEDHRPKSARIGVDVARFGADYGTIYVTWNGRVWRHDRLSKKTTTAYFRSIRDACLALKAKGVRSVHLRIDGGGGFGGGVVDRAREDLELHQAFSDFAVFEVHFNARPKDRKSYANLVTEMHAEVAESIKGLAILNAPEGLEADLCERTYDWKNWRGRDVKILQEKKDFRKDHDGRSPDDGDGFCLAVAPDRLFTTGKKAPASSSSSYTG